jgi:hypothetical protein
MTMTTNELLAKYIDKSGKTNPQIATEAGFPKANVISMLKRDMPVPIHRVPGIAKAIGLNPVHLMKRAMTDQCPENWKALVDVIPGLEAAAKKETA